MAPADPGRGRPTDLAVEAGRAPLDHFYDVQLTGKERLNRGNDLQAGTGGQLL